MGFGVGSYMGCIHYEYPLLAALLKRWKSTTSTFHLLIGEMTITMEDIHHLYCLPIYVQRIHNSIDREVI